MAFLGSAQVILPGYKDGGYWIIRSDKNIKLPASITSLSTFDIKGYAIFEDEKNMGVLDSNGRIVFTDEERDFIMCGSGLFALSNGINWWIVNAESQDTVLSEVEGFEILNLSYISCSVGKDTVLMHLSTGKRWSKNNTVFRGGNLYRSVYYIQDSIVRYLYTPDGEEVLLDSTTNYFTNLLTYTINSKQFVLTDKRQIEVPLATANIHVQDPYLSYFDGKKAHLFQLEEDQEIVTVPYDKIWPLYHEGYIVTKGEKKGILNSSFQLKIPVIYEEISALRDYFIVRRDGLEGLMDKNYRLRIPCEFSQIYSDSVFFYTTNNSDMHGLYTKDYRQILATFYDRILINDRLIKAYKLNKLRILKLDANDRIISDVILDNALTAKQPNENDPFTFDKRLLTVGWFYERTAIRDSIGFIQRYNTKWGLRNNRDSLISPAKYTFPFFVGEMPFSGVGGPPLKFSMLNLNFKIMRCYRLIEFSTGRMHNQNNYLFFEAKDGDTRNYFRFATTSGYGIHFKSGEIKTLDYISRGHNSLLPYAVDGKIELVDIRKDALPFYQWLPIGRQNQMMTRVSLKNGKEKYVLPKDALWNFIDLTGADRFDEPFTFANDFHKGTSIVKRKEGWGVVDENQVIIPCEYASIERIRMWNDTLFLVQKSSKRFQFLDSNLLEVATDYNYLSKRKNDMAMLSARADNAVFYQGSEIQDELKNAKFLNNNYWVVREKGEYTVLDSEASPVLTTSNKPIRMLSDDFVLVMSKGKEAIIDLYGDTVIPFGIKKLEEFPHFYMVENNSGRILYDRNFKLLRAEKPKEKLMANSVTDTYAVIKKKKIRRYKDGQQLETIKNDMANEIEIFQNNYFVGKDFILEDTTVLHLTRKDQYIIHEDGVLQLLMDKSKNVFYNQSLKELMFEVNVKNVKYMGSGVVNYIADKKRYIRNREQVKELPFHTEFSKTFNSGLCLMQIGNRFTYLDTNLEIVINKRFEEAKPFLNGMAEVKKYGAWTLMSTNGELKSFPSYSSINPISTNFYQTYDKPSFGIYDNHGNEIIPPIYEKIVFITPQIIQVILKGEMGYIDITGKPIFSIH